MAIESVSQFPWAALITAFAGLLGALSGAYLANKFAEKRWADQISYEKEKEKSKNLSVKGEELHVLVSKWSKSTLNYQLCQMRVVLSKLSESQFHELMEKNPPEQGVHDRLEALIFLYFPDFESHMKVVRKNLMDGNSAYDEFTRGVTDQKTAYKTIILASEVIEDELNKIMLGIRNTMKEIN